MAYRSMYIYGTDIFNSPYGLRQYMLYQLTSNRHTTMLLNKGHIHHSQRKLESETSGVFCGRLSQQQIRHTNKAGINYCDRHISETPGITRIPKNTRDQIHATKLFHVHSITNQWILSFQPQHYPPSYNAIRVNMM